MISSSVHANNIVVNNVKSVTLHFLALSDKTGAAEILTPSNMYALPGMDKHYQTRYLLQSLTGDEFCRTYDYHPNYIKIDVDGAEVQVVRGLIEILHRQSTKSVLIEVTEDSIGPVSAVLRSAGFRITRVADHGEALNLIFSRVSPGVSD
jgi:FkbM family methyltransferase